jgi:chromosomal replication initiator protein
VLSDTQEGAEYPLANAWFGGISAVAQDGDSLTISVPNPFAREYVETRFKPALEASLRERLSPTARLRVIVGAAG